MNDYAGHPFIRLPDDVGDLSWHSVVPQKSPEGLPVNVVERLFIVDKVVIQWLIPLQRLFQNYSQGCALIRARSIILNAGLLVTVMLVVLRLSFGSAGCD
ncbi:hypothetical protein DPMN_126189 [Dreissena polymorpha]|uniref:Uncharacterized protein n=1 Tax=Dreissena polymorpha TaxID=45954 RepID=A0A9D4GZP1_DREPO|nr:hypothetical protein DPMN_126189 [Dreissena polymorpha]